MKQLMVLAVAAALAGAAWAQPDATAGKAPRKDAKKEAPAKVAPPAPKPAPVRFSMAMVEAGRIDPAYVGHATGDVISAIEKLAGVKKGEFESTADFTARRTAALAGKFLDGASVEDVFAFSLPVPKGSRYSDGLRYTFNADTGEVAFYALPTSSKYLPLNGIGAPDYQTNRRERSGLDQLKLDRKIEATSTYEGSNAYGAKVTVEKTTMSIFGIAANRIPFLRFERDSSYGNPPVAAQVKMDNARAAAELPNLKALVVMKLADPFVLYHFMHKEPKRDSPSEILAQEKYLTGDVLGIVYYSGTSGEVFARLPENFGKPDPQPEAKPAAQ